MKRKFSDAEVQAALNFTLRRIDRYSPIDRRRVEAGEKSLHQVLREARLIYDPFPDDANVKDA